MKIPVLVDDYSMYEQHMEFDSSEQLAVDMIKANDHVAFGLHGCYADYWLPHYRTFLAEIHASGNLDIGRGSQ